MNSAWHRDVVMLGIEVGSYDGYMSYENVEKQSAAQQRLFGVPVEVRDDGGVPHLEVA
jgi:hypothetical protein